MTDRETHFIVLFHDDWCWLPIKSVIPNFLVVVAVGHGRPLISPVNLHYDLKLIPSEAVLARTCR